jgi:hypothetical protein
MSITIIPISRKDIEVFKSTVFTCNVVGKDKKDLLKEKLAAHYEKKPDSLEAALSYAAINIMPEEDDSPFEKKDSAEEAIETFNQIVEKHPGHWLSRYYSLKMQSLFAEYYGDEEELVKETVDLIKLQGTVAHKPYFVLPYILLVKLLCFIERQDEAAGYLEKAEDFPAEPVEELAGFLDYIFQEVEGKLRDIDENEMADRVMKLGQLYFPES